MGKVIFLNIDGTIRDFDGTIPASGIKALQKARRNGHEIVVNTGRAHFRISKSILDIGFDGVIASSGGYVEYRGERIGYKYFTQLAYIEFMKDLLENHCVVEMANDKEGYVLKDSWEEYLRIVKRLAWYASDMEISLPKPVETLLDVPEVQRLVVFSDRVSRREIVSKWGYSFHITDLKFPYEGRWAGEITPNYITKAEGLRQIMKIKECPLEDSIAIGSGDNDTEMLAVAGYGIAMGNGTKEAQVAARHVTKRLEEDGLWKAFDYMGLL